MNIALHHGDCLEIMPTLDLRGVDAVITDPPYGVKFRQGKAINRYGASTRFHERPIAGDDKPFDPSHLLGFRVIVLFGANNYADKLPASRGWIFWHKRPDMRRNDFGDGELIYTNQDRVLQYYRHTWDGVLRDSENGDPHYHPTQKPVALMVWLIEQYTSPGETILDPYMGSGATGRACIQLANRNFIGIESDREYFDTASRLMDAERQRPMLPLFGAAT